MAEEAAFARGTSAEMLMDQAGAALARFVVRFFPNPGRCIVFVGKGHNGGDALVAAKHLCDRNWKVEVRLIFKEEDCSDLTRKKLQDLRGLQSRKDLAGKRPHNFSGLPLSPIIILDGLLGLGAKPPLREPVRKACREMNRLRREINAFVFAVDLPTGIDGDSGKADRDSVVADFTVTVGFAKHGLVADSAIEFVGRLEVVSLTELHAPQKADSEIVASGSTLRSLLQRRKYDAYKNQFGRIGIVAGSKGFAGAAIMCSFGALRAGAGLVEVFVPEEIYQIVAGAAPPEAMVKPIKSYRELLKEKIDVWAVGPGLGKSNAIEIIELIEKAKQPMVVDADGLNILSDRISTLTRCKGPRLVTPHPGEMKRLFPRKTKARAETAKRFCSRFPVALLLKGARTIVAQRGQPLSYNTTGNPGMATGGMGDVLTGVCAALIGQKISPYNAGRLGAWLCGRAAEIAIFNNSASEESLLPRDLLDHLGFAFTDLRDSGV
jgi:ADP-dependent NAD(P)H-hydrate dehydratase / NAD(P)H-hydrate epimerase